MKNEIFGELRKELEELNRVKLKMKKLIEDENNFKNELEETFSRISDNIERFFEEDQKNEK